MSLGAQRIKMRLTCHGTLAAKVVRAMLLEL